MLGVVFSLEGTLVDDDGLYVAALRRVVRELIAEDALAVDEADIEPLVERLGPTVARSRGIETIASLLRYGRMSPTTLTARVRMTAVDLVPRHSRTLDDARGVLAELRELGLPQTVLSEGWSGVDHARARFAGFEGPVLTAEDVPGGASRSLSAFATVAARLRLSADRLWFVGVDPRRDIAPARAAGFQTVWLNRDGTPYPSGVRRPDHTIGTMSELLELLREPYMQSALALRSIYRATLRFRPGHAIHGDPLRED